MVKVLSPGFYSTIQDIGRFGYQEYGVPYSGVMDLNATTLVNMLLGNDKNDSVVEMTMTGAKLQFSIKTAIVISGADMSPMINGNSIQLNKIVAINPNDILSFGKLNTGFRSYLGVLGGFNTETVMHSKSMYKSITKSFMLAANDKLQITEVLSNHNKKHASIRFDTSYVSSKDLVVFKGPEFDMLSNEQQKALFNKSYTISKNNNRMAYQIEEVVQNNLKPIITSAVLPGTVQLTPSGKLIVLMRDCQTTGGYPRVLQLEKSSISILAQKFTSKTIQFKLKAQI
ncbi:biotin-dependent carboxyltransferase family protein [Algibacter aquimarinus]|uniref:Biotin-dependent carboxyltransferase family protein n=1 Tax=Algibacter aquimarinus TaxID=1136748 RepID=A0ABP9HGK7_9FLAO